MENNQPEEAPAAPQSVTLTVTYNGRDVSVNGPLQDKVLCYGLLHAAAEAIRDFNKANELKAALETHANGIVKPNHLSIQ